MSFQILDIVLYSHDGQVRKLSLRPNRVNVITGASKTGKTALIDIAEYCLGSDECRVSEGVVRDSVSWYGLRLQGSTTQMLVARRAPEEGQAGSSAVFYSVGREVSIPAFSDLRPVTNTEGLVSVLSAAAGIEPNEQRPIMTSGIPYPATVRHASFFNYQRQDEISNSQFLFHRQGEQFIPTTIRDVLPFFLGAVGADELEKKNELRRLQRELRQLERHLAELTAIQGEGLGRAGALYAEAAGVGLVEAEPVPEEPEEVRQALRGVLDTSIAVERNEDIDGVYSSRLDERESLRRKLAVVNEEIRSLKTLADERLSFRVEANEQASRLISLEMYPHSSNGDGQPCPLCLTTLENATPQSTYLRTSLEALNEQVTTIGSEPPRLHAVLSQLEEQAAGLRVALRDNSLALESLRGTDERIESMRDSAERRSHVLGRISLYVESLAPPSELSRIANAVDNLTYRVKELQEELSDEATEAKFDSILARLSVAMTAWSQRLQLEHAPAPFRLDARRLTVVAERDEGPLPMNRMGSGENWVGCHLICHLALHQWFAERNRPVPRFLFLDQPSQVYFPTDEEIEDLSDTDWPAVTRLLGLIFEAAEHDQHPFQVILTEHADLGEDWYREAIVERWRQGSALIPMEWISN